MDIQVLGTLTFAQLDEELGVGLLHVLHPLAVVLEDTLMAGLQMLGIHLGVFIRGAMAD